MPAGGNGKNAQTALPALSKGRHFPAILFYSFSGKSIMEGTGETDSQQKPPCPDPPEKKACNKSFKDIKNIWN